MWKLILYLLVLVLKCQSHRTATAKFFRVIAGFGISGLSMFPDVSLEGNQAHVASVFARNLPEETGATKTRIGSIDSLRPISRMSAQVKNALAVCDDKSKLEACKDTLGKEEIFPAKERDFKRLFDEYSMDVSYKQKFLDQNAFLVYYTKVVTSYLH